MADAVLIAGPTASGKSALALRIAEATGGVIVNTDSMQVYGVLDRLTARPSSDELARADHVLYGHVPPAHAYSTGRWLADVAALRDAGTFDGRQPSFVGGTGLYFKALLDGLSEMPDVPAAVREHWRARLAGEGAQALHAVLASRDPQSADRIGSADGQRIVRALEVLDASGEPIGAWQGRRGAPLVDRKTARMIVIEPDRDWLGLRIEARVRAMIDEGALDEVRAIQALRLSPAMPAMKAIGVREFAAFLDGSASLEAAIERVASATRQYAKRQSTWFRHQLGDGWQRVADPAAVTA